MLVAWWMAVALAQTCPDVGDKVREARAWFDDAELERAKQAIAEAYDVLGCQQRVVSTAELLSLYRLDGLISLALNDPKGATYATIRAVAADHLTGAPPEDYGPVLAEEYARWADRLGGNLVYVRVAGAGMVYVDGRGIDASQWLQVAEGEHLVQIQAGDALRSEVMELVDDHVVVTGVPGPPPVLLPAPPPPPEPEPTPAPQPAPGGPVVDIAPPTVTGRRRPAALFVGGVLSGGLGAAAILWARDQEARFLARSYHDDVYNGCLAGQDCFPSARARAIQADADLVNAAYATGYGLSALGGGLLLTGAVGIGGRPTSVHLGWRF